MGKPIPTFLINLDRRSDRLAAVTDVLNKVSIAFERVSAVDAAVASETELAASRTQGPIGYLSPGTRSCTASHLKALRRFLETEARHALILEDDVVVRPELAKLLLDDHWISGRAHILKIEKFGPLRPSKILAGPELGLLPYGIGNFRPMLSRHTGSAAYIVSRQGAETILSFAGEINVPIDHFLFNETVSPLFNRTVPAIVSVPLAWQSIDVGMGSNIATGGQGNGATSPFSNAIRSLRRAWNEVRLLPKQALLFLIGRATVLTLETPISRGKAPPRIVRKLVKSRQ